MSMTGALLHWAVVGGGMCDCYGYTLGGCVLGPAKGRVQPLIQVRSQLVRDFCCDSLRAVTRGVRWVRR